MIRNNKSKPLPYMALRFLWKLALFALEVIASFAKGDRSRPRYVPLKAQYLHDEGLISDEEYAKSIYGTKHL